ncbi:hypothetical protein C5167_010991 [Papaver somniferum]|uniref:Acetyl-coenzyme A carboxylase carboxyl transferase subunit beta domain-containing protein n=1 Tax=Papaver somniferum TaxID=3469 RepID=A0A4Y7K305_PAPSO|nr:hypothetical protein C5167_010991 [Papaver somniferum]
MITEDLEGAAMQCIVSGVSAHFAEGFVKIHGQPVGIILLVQDLKLMVFAKAGAKMAMAVSCAKVNSPSYPPRWFDGSFGAGNDGMSGRAFSLNFLFRWPTAKAAGVLPKIEKSNKKKQGGEWSTEEEKFKMELLWKQVKQNEAHITIRKVLGLCLSVSMKNVPE